MVLVEPLLHDPEVAGVRLEQEVERVAEEGDEADRGVEGDIAGHPRDLEFRHAEIPGFPDQPSPHRRGDDVADHRHQADDRIHAEAEIRAGHRESALEQHAPSPRSGGAPRRDRGRPAAGRRCAGNSSGPSSAQTRAAIRVPAGWRAKGIGPEAGQPRRDQRPADRRGQRDERRQPAEEPVGLASCAWRSAGAAPRSVPPAAPRRRPDRRPPRASQVNWRRYQMAIIAGATASISRSSAGAARTPPGPRRRRSAASRGADRRRAAGSRARRAWRPAPARVRRPARRWRAPRARARIGIGEVAQSGTAGRGSSSAIAGARVTRGCSPGTAEAATSAWRSIAMLSARRTAGSASGPPPPRRRRGRTGPAPDRRPAGCAGRPAARTIGRSPTVPPVTRSASLSAKRATASPAASPRSRMSGAVASPASSLLGDRRGEADLAVALGGDDKRAGADTAHR